MLEENGGGGGGGANGKNEVMGYLASTEDFTMVSIQSQFGFEKEFQHTEA